MYLEEVQAQDMCREKASIHTLGSTFRRYCLGIVSRLLGDKVAFVQNAVSLEDRKVLTTDKNSEALHVNFSRPLP
jgi:hypothetical protein